MSKEKSGISAFQKYLTVWVILQGDWCRHR